MEFIAVYCICSVLVTLAAVVRGRSGLGWLVLSLFISPLFALIALLLMPNKAKQATEAVRHAELLAAVRGDQPPERVTPAMFADIAREPREDVIARVPRPVPTPEPVHDDRVDSSWSR